MLGWENDGSASLMIYIYIFPNALIQLSLFVGGTENVRS